MSGLAEETPQDGVWGPSGGHPGTRGAVAQRQGALGVGPAG